MAATREEDALGADARSARDTSIPPELYPVLARAPLQHIARKSDIGRIVFTEGIAALMVDAALLESIRFKNHERSDAARLERLEQSILARGYVPTDPVICRVGRKGKWSVVDGGHRLTALRRLAGRSWLERLARLCDGLGAPGRAVGRALRRIRGEQPRIYVILFSGARSLMARADAASKRPDRSSDGSQSGLAMAARLRV